MIRPQVLARPETRTPRPRLAWPSRRRPQSPVGGSWIRRHSLGCARGLVALRRVGVPWVAATTWGAATPLPTLLRGRASQHANVSLHLPEAGKLLALLPVRLARVRLAGLLLLPLARVLLAGGRLLPLLAVRAPSFVLPPLLTLLRRTPAKRPERAERGVEPGSVLRLRRDLHAGTSASAAGAAVTAVLLVPLRRLLVLRRRR